MLEVLHASQSGEAPVSEAYEGRQIVGMDLHRRRSVLVRMSESGALLETVRISNESAWVWRRLGSGHLGCRGGR
jgi:hypothetical protein